MNRTTAERRVLFIGDDGGSFRIPMGRPCDAPAARDWLIGWDALRMSAPDALFVRVRSYLPDATLNREEAVNIAINGLADLRCFTDRASAVPDHVIAPEPLLSPGYCSGTGTGTRSALGCGCELTAWEAAHGGLCRECNHKASLP